MHGGKRAVVNQRKVTGGRFVSLGSVSEMIKAETKQAGREFSRCKKNEHVYDRMPVRHFFFLEQLRQTKDDLPPSAPLMLIRRPDVIHRQRGSLIRPRPLMIPGLVFMNLVAAKQTWQQNNRKTTETWGGGAIDAKHHQIEIIPPHQLGQAAGAGAGVQRSGGQVAHP